ncbi:MAG: PaaI family thioesterase [Kiloniellales bacterium]|nr:PaaI family thioesterase [Kiloniellales bacterium]
MDDPIRAKGAFADLVGYRLTKWERDLAEVSLCLEAHHMNRSGVMHGGVLTTLMDTACGYSGTFTPPEETPKRAFTLSLDCHFVSAAQTGEQLTARAWRTGGGRSLFFTRCEITAGDGRLVGQGEGVFKYISKRG